MNRPAISSLAWLAIAAAATTVLAGCAHYTNTVVAQIPSPDGKVKAVVFQRSSSAEDVSTQISLFPAGDEPDSGSGNIFAVAPGKPLAYDRDLKVDWKQRDIVRITYRHDASVVKYKRALTVDVSPTEQLLINVHYEHK